VTPDLVATRKQAVEDMITNAENYVAIYARQSNKSEKDHSAEVQLQKGQELAIKKNLIIYKTYSEKISGREDPYYEREQFNNLIQDAEEGLFKNVIVYKRDRLSRDMQDFLEIKKKFKKLGIKVIYSCEQEFQSNGDPTSDFIENIIAAVAALEPSMIRDRAMAGKKEQRKNKVYSPGGSIPYGVQLVEKDVFKELCGDSKELNGMRPDCKFYAPKKETWDLIKKLFNKFISDKNINTSGELCNALVDDGIEIPYDFDKDNVRGIILNPIYGGLQLRSLDFEFTDSFKVDDKKRFIDIDMDYFQDANNAIGLVDSNTWCEAAKKWLLERDPFDKKIRSTNYLFKGLLVCSKCEKKISKSNDLYFCGTKGCTRINKGDLNRHLLGIIINNLITPKNSKVSIDEKIEELDININSNRADMINHNIKMEEHVRSYLNDPEDEVVCNLIEKGYKEQSLLISEGEKLKFNITYLKQIREKMLNEYNKINMYSLIETMIKQEELTQRHLIKNIEQVKIYGNRQSSIKPEIKYR
jgi:site-specific DNA recombinase